MANTTYIDVGSGDALVFLHGFCESKQVWAAFMKPLQQKFRTIALDLPGHGNNIANISEYSMESMAEDVKLQLEKLNVKRCIMIGHSMGGYVSMAFAEKYGPMLSGLCLFHSSAFADTDEKKENRSKSIGYVERHGVDNFINPFVEPLFYRENRGRLKEEINMMKDIGTQTPKESVIGALTAMRDRPDRSYILKELKCPVLFIFGKNDGAVPLDKALEQCHLPSDSMVYFIDETGHMGMFEHPFKTGKTLEKFAETIYG
ncbi:alpha/beta fold hydrolase [Pontibacter silvestris]|uniref:Alpha/beta fold hydrolase n=1 Tax=Pontibacter silvestris TaxID=2305183 RepID=A0ABW4X407_9BACT|nr:alpha/beta hydrolase [Pontibacter silvestris]MCC9137077.1 alpha/beta hydrolase [Pontibacter silvestris]